MRLSFAGILLLAAFALPVSGAAQTVEQFYKGKSVT